MRFSKIIVAAVIAMNALFAIAVLAVFWHTGNEPGVLVGAWFTFTTGELWTLGKIKRAERRKNANTETEIEQP
jgi:Na+(H+)/acetate symporter ActP